MARTPRLDHVAYRVRDLQWYLDFFLNVMGMEITMESAPPGGPHQVWVSGMQLIESPDWSPADLDCQRFTHIGYEVEDNEAMLERVYAVAGVEQFGDKRNWFTLPEGPTIELIPHE